ncbi:hypothetical protein CCC_01627 [Paramagnetospirillum magnetotacticum MS-1]|uniref:Uncharacterized protein n=1 Tax=Paramagnetospirillum magnetotacticum MS-1 TaxID=272627 RepID=A0A0C2UVA7_PARME|nr:hypothetical protein CCC_01627 [Paramagnetospirillum magnetotacticum MS-1]
MSDRGVVPQTVIYQPCWGLSAFGMGGNTGCASLSDYGRCPFGGGLCRYFLSLCQHVDFWPSWLACLNWLIATKQSQPPKIAVQ